MIEIRYIYSASVVIKSPDFSVLSDPWFTDGIYDGTWFQFPKVQDPIKAIGKVDFIYVSHIHPDHYDPIFLRQYLKTFPDTRVIIANFKYNFLAKKMSADGIPHEILKGELQQADTTIKIFPNEAGSVSDVDSAFTMKWKNHAVVNLNDNPYNEDLLDSILEFHPHYQIALLPFTGAGPYPQTYYRDEKSLREKALKKKQDFFNRYMELKKKIKPDVSIPFAGKYLLGGKKAKLNMYRGVADPVEVLQFDPSAIVLEDGGHSSIDTLTLKSQSQRIDPYSQEKIDQRIKEISCALMPYEKYFNLPNEVIPWKRLLPKAYFNALKQSEANSNYFFCLEFSKNSFFVMNCKQESNEFSFCNRDKLEDFSPRSEIEIDYRYLFGLLTSIYHWNNAEIGSQYMVKRIPDEFKREVQRFLNFFHL